MIRTKKILKSIRKTDYNQSEITVEENDHQNTKSEQKKRKHLHHSYIKHINEKQTVCYTL